MTKSKHLRLKDDVGSDRAVDEEDTLNTKYALKKIGYYGELEYGMTGYPGQQMLDGIEKVQKDRGLTRDGIMKPGGETEWEINRIADEQDEKGSEKASLDNYPNDKSVCHLLRQQIHDLRKKKKRIEADLKKIHAKFDSGVPKSVGKNLHSHMDFLSRQSANLNAELYEIGQRLRQENCS